MKNCRCRGHEFNSVLEAEREFIRFHLQGSITRTNYLRLLPAKTWGFCEYHDEQLRSFAFSSIHSIYLSTELENTLS